MAQREEEIDALDLMWRLSQVNPNTPRPLTLALDMDPHAHDSLQAEHLIAEWKGIAESYRELCQVCIESAARNHQLSRTLSTRLAEVIQILRRRS